MYYVVLNLKKKLKYGLNIEPSFRYENYYLDFDPLDKYLGHGQDFHTIYSSIGCIQIFFFFS